MWRAEVPVGVAREHKCRVLVNRAIEHFFVPSVVYNLVDSVSARQTSEAIYLPVSQFLSYMPSINNNIS